MPEIYALAESVAAVDETDRTFQAVMERATAVLAAQTDLPPFEAWSASYLADPASYDEDLIGFWREQV